MTNENPSALKGTKSIELVLNFSDADIANTLLNAEPPPGVLIEPPPPGELSATDASVAANLTVHFTLHISLSQVTISAAVAWLLKKFLSNAKNKTKKQTRINGVNVPLNERDVLLFIEQQHKIMQVQEQERQRAEQIYLNKQP